MDDNAVGSFEGSEIEILVPRARSPEFEAQEASGGLVRDKEGGDHHGTRRLKNLSTVPLRTSLHFGGPPPLHHTCTTSLIHCQD